MSTDPIQRSDTASTILDDDASSNVKFVTKRSMSELREQRRLKAERSKTLLQSRSSTLDLEASIVEEPKTEADVTTVSASPSPTDSTESVETKPVLWQGSMPKWRLIVILGWYAKSLPYGTH
jgi:hypothetical protein